MTMGLLVLKGVVGHPLPLQHVLLFKDLVIEDGAAIYYAHHEEYGDGDEVRQPPSKQILTYIFHADLDKVYSRRTSLARAIPGPA